MAGHWEDPMFREDCEDTLRNIKKRQIQKEIQDGTRAVAEQPKLISNPKFWTRPFKRIQNFFECCSTSFVSTNP